MPSLRDKILTSIHAHKLTPRPKWQYVLGHILLWSICILTLLAGSVAFSLMLMEFGMPERVFIHWMDMQENAGFLLVLPYLWLLGVFLALCLGYFLFSRTGTGYRIHIFVVIWSLLLGSCVIGWILFSTHAIQWWEERFQIMEPRYRDFRRGMKRMMPRPEEGILPLRVGAMQENIFFGSDPAGRSWEVLFICAAWDCDTQKIKIWKPILFHGVVKNPGKFEANSFSRPEKWWKPPLTNKVEN